MNGLVRVPFMPGSLAGQPVVRWLPSSPIDCRAVAIVHPDLLVARSLVTGVTARGVVESDAHRAAMLRSDIHARATAHLRPGQWFPRRPAARPQWKHYSRDDYFQHLLRLLPRGRAWPRDGVEASICQAWAGEFFRAEEDGRSAVHERDPRRMRHLLPDWEQMLGLPGTGTEDERRRDVLAAWLAGGKLAREDVERILREMGIDAKVAYPRPFRCGISACGDALATYWSAVLQVTLVHGTDTEFVRRFFGRMGAGSDLLYIKEA